MGDFASLVWIIILLQLFVHALQKRVLEAKRRFAMRRIEARRKSRVITMIHRQESMSLLGFPIARYIDIEGGEVGRHARRPGGGRDRDGSQRRPGIGGPADRHTAGRHVPGGTILAALQRDNPNRKDQTLILGDVAEKAVRQVYATTYALLRGHLPEERAHEVASKLSEGYWTHDHPICFDEALSLGLPVSDAMPKEIYGLMDLYPRSGRAGLRWSSFRRPTGRRRPACPTGGPSTGAVRAAGGDPTPSSTSTAQGCTHPRLPCRALCRAS